MVNVKDNYKVVCSKCGYETGVITVSFVNKQIEKVEYELKYEEV